MKKNLMRIMSAILVAALMISCAVTSFAADLGISYKSELSADKKTVTVTVTLADAVGVQSGDLCLAYDTTMYEYVDYEQLCSSDVSIAAGNAVTEDGLCTCSFVLVNEITKDMCDSDGNMTMLSYTFNVLKTDSDVNDFYLYADSLYVADNPVTVAAQGNASHASEHSTGGVLAPTTTAKSNGGNASSSSSSTGNNKKTLIIIIAAVALAAAVGIILTIVNKNKHGDDDKADGENDKTKAEESGKNTAEAEKPKTKASGEAKVQEKKDESDSSENDASDDSSDDDETDGDGE